MGERKNPPQTSKTSTEIAPLLRALENQDFQKAEKLSKSLDLIEHSLSLVGGFLAPAYIGWENYENAARWVLEKGNFFQKAPEIALFGYAALGDAEKVKLLLEEGQNPHTKLWEGYNIFYSVVLRNKPQVLAELLWSVYATQEDAAYCLDTAARYGCEPCLAIALEHMSSGAKEIKEAFLTAADSAYRVPKSFKLLAKKMSPKDLQELEKVFEKKRAKRTPYSDPIDTENALSAISKEKQYRKILQHLPAQGLDL